MQSLAYSVHFPAGCNHRYHDFHVAAAGRAQQSPKLGPEQFLLLQRQAQASAPQGRVLLLRQMQPAGFFVRSDVHGADHSLLPCHGFGHFTVSIVLFVFCRRGVFAEEEKLRTEQPDAFCTRREQCIDVLGSCNVCVDLCAAYGIGRRLRVHCFRPLFCLCLRCFLQGRLVGVFLRIHSQCAIAQNQRRTGPYLRDSLLAAVAVRNIQIPCQDGHMGCGRTLGRHNA